MFFQVIDEAINESIPTDSSGNGAILKLELSRDKAEVAKGEVTTQVCAKIIWLRFQDDAKKNNVPNLSGVRFLSQDEEEKSTKDEDSEPLLKLDLAKPEVKVTDEVKRSAKLDVSEDDEIRTEPPGTGRSDTDASRTQGTHKKTVKRQALWKRKWDRTPDESRSHRRFIVR